MMKSRSSAQIWAVKNAAQSFIVSSQISKKWQSIFNDRRVIKIGVILSCAAIHDDKQQKQNVNVAWYSFIAAIQLCCWGPSNSTSELGALISILPCISHFDEAPSKMRHSSIGINEHTKILVSHEFLLLLQCYSVLLRIWWSRRSHLPCRRLTGNRIDAHQRGNSNSYGVRDAVVGHLLLTTDGLWLFDMHN